MECKTTTELRLKLTNGSIRIEHDGNTLIIQVTGAASPDWREPTNSAALVLENHEINSFIETISRFKKPV